MYDDLAAYYDLVYADWEASMRRHGDFISQFLPAGARVLDIAAGIGTQALPLAARGFEVVARDLSRAAIERLRREAVARGPTIDAAPADMRHVAHTVEPPFDAIICFDNALPHLLTDADIVATLSGLGPLLGPEGVVLVSVRDYGAVDRAPHSVHPHGERTKGDRRFRVAQEWRWYDEDHYETTMIVEERVGEEWIDRVRSSSRYYAIPLPDLLELFARAGFAAELVSEPAFFQPVIRARAA